MDINEFIAAARQGKWDGQMIVFPSTHPKWSFARLECDQVVEVAEKRPISRMASVGIYYYRRAGDYLEAAMNVIRKNASVSGEFYICPAFNELILAGKRVGVFPIEGARMFSLDTPERIDLFLGSGHANA